MPTAPKKIVATLERAEIEAWENAAETERDKLIVRVLANTGLRLGELLGLRPADLIQNERGWFLKVRGRATRNGSCRSARQSWPGACAATLTGTGTRMRRLTASS